MWASLIALGNDHAMAGSDAGAAHMLKFGALGWSLCSMTVECAYESKALSRCVNQLNNMVPGMKSISAPLLHVPHGCEV